MKEPPLTRNIALNLLSDLARLIILEGDEKLSTKVLVHVEALRDLLGPKED